MISKEDIVFEEHPQVPNIRLVFEACRYSMSAEIETMYLEEIENFKRAVVKIDDKTVSITTGSYGHLHEYETGFIRSEDGEWDIREFYSMEELVDGMNDIFTDPDQIQTGWY